MLVALILAGCRQQSAVVESSPLPQLIQPPFEKLDPEFQVFTINSNNTDSIVLQNGSVITIPAHSLTDANGTTILGQVRIEYREFHDAADVLLSGIPMEYYAAGERKQMETAGMFEIKAFQEDKELFIKEGNSIHVKLASYEAEDNYSFFWLDKDQREWQFIDHPELEANTAKTQLIKEVELKKDRLLEIPFKEGYFALNYDAVLDVYYNDNWQDIDNNNEKHRLKRKTDAYNLDWLNIESWESIQYKGNYHRAAMMVWKNRSGKKFPGWLAKKGHKYEKMFTHLYANVYNITLKHPEKDITFTAKVEAIMPLKGLFAFEPEYWSSNFQEAMNQIEKEENRVRLMADVYRSFEINQFGIYNYDRFMKDANKVSIIANFVFDEKINNKLNTIDMVYCLPDNEKTVIKYPSYDWNKVSLIPGISMKFIAVLPDNKVAIFDNDSYLDINITALKELEAPSYTFHMQTLDKKIETADDLRTILGI